MREFFGYLRRVGGEIVRYTEEEMHGVAALCVVVLAGLAVTFWSGAAVVDRGAEVVGIERRDSVRGENRPGAAVADTVKTVRQNVTQKLFKFDPNTASTEDFSKLGFSQKQAQVIINYRNSGAIFRRAEDFLKCYAVDEDIFRKLQPYIIIGEQQRVSATSTERQTRPKIEINSADSATIRSVYGVGEVITRGIMRHRERLGGFYEIGQLREVYAVNDENFETISKQFSVDTTIIRKININFATSNELVKHQYVSGELVNRILQSRKMKGGWKNLEELIDDNILTHEQARKLRPYVVFD